ncbi:MAG: hypothetical protein ABI569_11045 [Casimicrobiaceae bacterium]
MHTVLRALALVSMCSAWPCAAQSYQDWWWNPDQSGHGLNIGQQDNILFVSWFTYDEQGQGMWLVTSGTLSGKTLTGNWSRTTGPKLGTPFDPLQVTTSTVGTVTITFADLHRAKMDWTVNAKSGTVDLVRQTWSPVVLSGIYAGSSHGNVCGQGLEFWQSNTLTITQTSPPGGPQTMKVIDVDNHGGTCTFDGEVTKSGSFIHHSGAYSCVNGGVLGTGTHNTTMLLTGEALTVFVNASVSGGCVATATITTIPQ